MQKPASGRCDAMDGGGYFHPLPFSDSENDFVVAIDEGEGGSVVSGTGYHPTEWRRNNDGGDQAPKECIRG